MISWYLKAGETQLMEPDAAMVGVYACRVANAEMGAPFHKDIFLMWYQGRWNYMGSAERYRGEVYGFTGPIPRTKG